MSWGEVEKARQDFSKMIDGLFHIESSDNVMVGRTDELGNNISVEATMNYAGTGMCFCTTEHKTTPSSSHGATLTVYKNGEQIKKISYSGTYSRNAMIYVTFKKGDIIKATMTASSVVNLINLSIRGTVVFGKEGIMID